ncbi:MAG: DUF937 domain-containing protein [Acidobacteria bacterium]|nr:DUF937 domain-containing protein [Acidobacteriota bacterium]
MNLTDMIGGLMGGGEGGGKSLIPAVLEMLNNQPGGLQGLAQAFQQKGLGEVAASWIGTGANLPISADQLQQVLGSGVLQSLGSKVGLQPDAVAPQLAELLPGLVDKLTPGGAMPQGDLTSLGASLLGDLLGGQK